MTRVSSPDCRGSSFQTLVLMGICAERWFCKLTETRFPPFRPNIAFNSLSVMADRTLELFWFVANRIINVWRNAWGKRKLIWCEGLGDLQLSTVVIETVGLDDPPVIDSSKLCLVGTERTENNQIRGPLTNRSRL